MQVASERQDLQVQGIALRALGKSHFFAGRWNESLNRLNESNKICEQTGEGIVEGFNLFFIAQILFLQRKTKPGLQLFGQALERIEQAGPGLLLSYVLATAAECYAQAPGACGDLGGLNLLERL